MKNKKILIIINNLGVGGAERLVVDDINEMLRLNFDVYLVTLKKEKENSFLRECLIDKNNHFFIEFKNFFDYRAWDGLISSIKIIKPDIIFTHLWFANTVGRISAFFLRFKNIYSFEHNIDTVKSYKTIFMDIVLQFFCKKIIAVSSAVKKSLIRNFILASKIKVIINGIDINRFKDVKPFDRSILGIGQNDFVFISIGRLVYQKGFDILLDAFSKIDFDLNTHLVIVGDGPLKKDLMDKVLYLGLKNRVHFLGTRSDIAQLLKMSDSFTLFSRWEGLGIVIMEAVLSLKPIIITNFDAGKDILDDNTGFVVSYIDDLPFYMTKIRNGDFDKEQLLENMKNKADSFSIKNHVNSLINLI